MKQNNCHETGTAPAKERKPALTVFVHRFQTMPIKTNIVILLFFYFFKYFLKKKQFSKCQLNCMFFLLPTGEREIVCSVFNNEVFIRYYLRCCGYFALRRRRKISQTFKMAKKFLLPAD